MVYRCTSEIDQCPVIEAISCAVQPSPQGDAQQPFSTHAPTALSASQPRCTCAKPIDEPRGRKGLALRCDQEREMVRRRGVDDLAQLGVYRDFEMRLFAAIGLALVDRKDAVADVLASHLYKITAPLPGV